MIPEAFAKQDSYRVLKMPVVIVAGAEDRLIDTGEQSERLHRAIKHSVFRRVPGAGHMVHQTAPAEVLMAINQAAAGTSGNKPELTAA